MEVTEEDNKSITCIVTASGIYVAILSPLSETFQVSPNGALLNLKLDPIVSVRIPKRGCSEALDCCFSIIPFSDERLTLARRTHPSQTMDIRSLSPVYNFNYPGGEFKRPITLKLPLPQWLLSSGDSAGAPASAADSASVTIFYQPRPGLAEPWRILDPGSSLKLTKNSISFEARHLTRYCFASVSPTKAQRASLAMPLLCSWNTAMEGEILLFAKLEDRRWRLCVDCAPRNEIVERISDRVQAKGWLFLQSLQLQQQQQQQQEQQFSSFRRRPNSRRQADVGEESRRGAVRLRNGAIFIVRLAGSSDLALCQETETDNGPVAAVENCLRQVLVQYHQLLSDAPAIYRLVPTERCHTVATDFFDYKLQQQQQQQADLDSGNRAADSAQENETINFKSQISVLDESGDLVSEHEIVLSFDAVKTYLGLRPPTPPPPPTPTPPPSPPPPTQRGSTATAGAATIKRIPTLPRLRLRVNELDAAQARIESFQRLTAPRRHLQAPTSTRESKALSVRSLQTLSEHVRQGLTLAVHLSLPESAITGIGFDVLSAGGATSVASVTYKILTHWKRSVPLPERGSMARQLADALASMGRPDLARVLLECDDANCELTPSLLAS
ncbi:hypothetical protein BOX15_Mlig000188g1 [Macrostomum lignano]|uniref:Death domain-containing protein n=1 Tax=Macrostomum lignano TaxID=282301 RepID=A0A267E0Q2_9PLAT|nr:hypothetical protein BOX15_Mlig000188g1 [Macrostomum lignano]